jgi:hypothetical protein
MLRLLAPFLIGLAAVLVITDKRLLRVLARAEAEDVRTAIPISARNPLIRWRLRRLFRGGAVGRAPGDRYYVDIEGLRLFRLRRRRRILGMAAVVVILALLWTFYAARP